MRKEQVPQEANATLQGERKAVYAMDEQGRYVLVPSSGWEVEEAVTTDAVDEFRRLAETALLRAQAGEASPLEYHMYARRMDVVTLAQAAGMFAWRVRWHLKPHRFQALKPALLARYGEALGLSVEQLCALPQRERGA